MALLVVLVVAGVSLGVAEHTVTSFAPSRFNHGLNAVWIQHEWVGQQHTSAQYQQLAAILHAHGIRYVYAHAGPFDASGAIPPSRYPFASALVRALAGQQPPIIVLAWIGQITTAGGGVLDLGASAVRAAMVASAAHLVRLGFAGVQLDIEPTPDGSPAFLQLLRALRQRLPRAFVSVAGPKWLPNQVVASLVHPVFTGSGDLWTTAYYRAVSGWANQIVVMLYDTNLHWTPLYELALKQETTNVLDAVTASSQVLIGVPTYHDQQPGFDDHIENLTNAIQGVTAGLNNDDHTARFAGLAIYPFWETSAADWATFDHIWGFGAPTASRQTRSQEASRAPRA